MKYCALSVKTQSSTFRHPEFQNFHKTLHLPPPTTLIGFAGAAMGLSPQSAQKFFADDPFEMGVYGVSAGYAKDLWKYDDFKNRSIILKEMLVLNQFFLVYGSANESKLKRLKESFLDPVYALTLGNSDSIAKIEEKIVILEKTVTSQTINNCLVEGDIISKVLGQAAIDPVFSIYATTEPIAIDLPTQFNYEEAYGIRSVSKRKTISFVNAEMKLNIDIPGVEYHDVFIPTFKLYE